MKFVLAFDSFKNCLRAENVCNAFARGILRALPDAEISMIPLADGGEGTVASAAYSGNGVITRFGVTGPCGDNRVDADVFISGQGGHCVLECASACGIELIPAKRLDPLETTSYGLGELISKVIDGGHVRHILVGLGGSGTVDGGIGMLQALGGKFFDADGILIPSPAKGKDMLRAVRTDLSEVFECLKNVKITIASDVANPLCGVNGAARVFGPQKGASPETVELLDAGLEKYSAMIYEYLSSKDGKLFALSSPGDGAAGGLGFAFRATGAGHSVSGADAVMDMAGFNLALENADVVITGEGCSDPQTLNGKLPVRVLERTRKTALCAKVVLVSGMINDPGGILGMRFDGTISLADPARTLEENIADAETNLENAGAAILLK